MPTNHTPFLPGTGSWYVSLYSSEPSVAPVVVSSTAYARVQIDTGWDANGAPIMTDTAPKPPPEPKTIKTIWQHLKED